MSSKEKKFDEYSKNVEAQSNHRWKHALRRSGNDSKRRCSCRAVAAGSGKDCAIKFDRDTKRPARAEDSALLCLNEAVERLKNSLNLKLVLVASADPVRDRAEKDHGAMREEEDATGADLRFEDIAIREKKTLRLNRVAVFALLR
jgi:hypothetical protein